MSSDRENPDGSKSQVGRTLTTLTEAVVEDAALAWLESLGWTIAHGPDIATEERIRTGQRGCLRVPEPLHPERHTVAEAGVGELRVDETERSIGRSS